MTREEAIARIREHKIVHKMNEPRAIYISEALDMAIEALEKVIEPQESNGELPNGGWIPVSERLPNKGEYVLTTHKMSDGHICLDISWINQYTNLWENDFELDDDTIIAWKPLPEPYQEESEDKE